MSWDGDTYLLGGRRTGRGFGAESQWKARWEEKRRRAFAGGAIDHRPDPSAPFGTLARYGYLVPLKGDALVLYESYKQERGIREGLGDKDRFEFEARYIQQCRAANVEKQDKKKPGTRIAWRLAFRAVGP